MRHVFWLRRSAECDPTCDKHKRILAAYRGVLTSMRYDMLYRVPSLRAIAALLQAKYMPPLGPVASTGQCQYAGRGGEKWA
ncbi:hypothetical protein DWX75_02180 [Mitsuokella sp. AF21-1AC]|nr:hypothetical protein DWX75_02180 [Mitsuokella sp. AF21-1AC]